VKRVTHKLKSFGTCRIIAPDSSGEWVEHISKEDIEAGCQWENSRRFSQIASTYDPLLASFETTMANIPCTTGYSPLRWQSDADVMIPKSVASLRVDKLRTILLLDPEFNQNNKLLGRSLMRQAVKYSQMPAEQCASRKKHRAVEAALNKVLTQDI
jgi:hypothetical protein